MALADKSDALSLKLLINTQTKQVLFAEAGKDFVDFLFSILSLPVAQVIGLVGKHGMVGSLANVYESVQNLNENYMQSNLDKNTLLTPGAGARVPLLAIKCTPAAPKKLFRCDYCSDYVSEVSGERGFVKGVVTYMVMDDLVVKPMSTISSITMLNKFNVNNVGALEEKVVKFGINEAMKLLKTSLEAKNVLTRVFLK